jgi:VanZ family protein
MSISCRKKTYLWAICLASAFVVTHMPPPPVPARPIINDKVLHFTGFTALAIVGIWRLIGPPRPIGRGTVAATLVGLALYGGIDEWTQPYFQRTCEFGDWLADLCGAVVGITIALACHRFTLARARQKASC